MILHSNVNDHRYILIATNQYGVITLNVISNRRPTIDEGIEILKTMGYWMMEDVLTIHPAPKEILVIFGD